VGGRGGPRRRRGRRSEDAGDVQIDVIAAIGCKGGEGQNGDQHRYPDQPHHVPAARSKLFAAEAAVAAWSDLSRVVHDCAIVRGLQSYPQLIKRPDVYSAHHEEL
jgi:hypothetical protein